MGNFDHLIVENRGNKRKYDFSDMKVGDKKNFNAPNIQVMVTCIRYYVKMNQLDWKFKSFKDVDGTIGVVRIA